MKEAHELFVKHGLPVYRSHKVVRAGYVTAVKMAPDDMIHPKKMIVEVMDSNSNPVEVSVETINRAQIMPGKFYVQYEDGYESASPEQEFAAGYTVLKPLPTDGSLPMYRSHKLVCAAEVSAINGNTIEFVGGKIPSMNAHPETLAKLHATKEPAYLVIYENGYRSVCPKETFEKEHNIVFEGYESVYEDMNGLRAIHAPYKGNALNEDGSLTEGHRYGFIHPNGMATAIFFQDGPVPSFGVNGITNEHLIAVLIHRINVLNNRFHSEYNDRALASLQEALSALEQRTKDRLARGVEGQEVK